MCVCVCPKPQPAAAPVAPVQAELGVFGCPGILPASGTSEHTGSGNLSSTPQSPSPLTEQTNTTRMMRYRDLIVGQVLNSSSYIKYISSKHRETVRNPIFRELGLKQVDVVELHNYKSCFC